MYTLLVRERIEQKKQILVWIHPRDFIVRSPDNHSSICQRISVASNLSHLLFSDCLPSLPHDDKKHQTQISSRKSRRPPRHLFRTNAQTTVRRHETIPLVFQQETQDSEEKTESQKKRPQHQTIKLRHEHSSHSLEKYELTRLMDKA